MKVAVPTSEQYAIFPGYSIRVIVTAAWPT